MAADRYRSLTLALRVYRSIRSRWRTRAELAAELDLHERTIRRLIDAWRAAGVTVRERRRGDGPTAALEFRADAI